MCLEADGFDAVVSCWSCSQQCQHHAYTDGAFLEANANNPTMISTTVQLMTTTTTELAATDSDRAQAHKAQAYRVV